MRTICATAGAVGVGIATGLSPEVDPEEWVHARTIVVWGWNPLSTAPHLWRLILEARRRGARLIVVDPSAAARRGWPTCTCDRCPAPTPRWRSASCARCSTPGLADEEWCRAHALGYDELVERLASESVELQAERCGIPAGDLRELARALALDQPSLIRLGVGAQRHAGAPIAYRTIACIPALAGSWRHRGGGLAYIPTAMFGVLGGQRLATAPICVRAGRARSTCRGSARR